MKKIKKALYGLLVGALMLNGTVVTPLAAENSNVIYSQNFEKYSGGADGFVKTESAPNMTAVETDSEHGKSLRANYGWTTVNNLTTPVTEKNVYSFEIQNLHEKEGQTFIMRSKDSNGNYYYNFYIISKNFKYMVGTAQSWSYGDIGAVENDKWYQIDVVFDPENKNTGAVYYINGEKMAQTSLAQDDFVGMDFYVAADCPVYLDNISWTKLNENSFTAEISEITKDYAEITFSETVSSDALSAMELEVKKCENDQSVIIDSVEAVGYKKVKINFAESLDEGAEYKFVLPENLSSIHKNKLNGNIVTGFVSSGTKLTAEIKDDIIYSGEKIVDLISKYPSDNSLYSAVENETYGDVEVKNGFKLSSPATTDGTLAQTVDSFVLDESIGYDKDVTLEAEFYADMSAGNGGQIRIYLANNSARSSMGVLTPKDGRYQYFNTADAEEGNWAEIKNSLTFPGWHTLKTVFHFETGKADVYLDGTLMKSGLNINNFNKLKDGGNITKITLLVQDSKTTESLVFKSFKLSQESKLDWTYSGQGQNGTVALTNETYGESSINGGIKVSPAPVSDTLGQTTIKKTFDTQIGLFGDIEIEAKYYTNMIGSNCLVQMFVGNSSAKSMTSASVLNDGKLIYFNTEAKNEGEYTGLKAISSTGWHTVKTVYHMGNQTADVYYDGVMVKSGLKINNYNNLSAAGGIDTVSFLIRGIKSEDYAVIDSVRVSQYAESTAVKSVRLVDVDGNKIVPGKEVTPNSRKIEITFTGNVSEETLQEGIKLLKGNSEVSYKGVLENNVYTMTLDEFLLGGADYTLSIDKDIVKDSQNIGIANDYSWSFKTKEGTFKILEFKFTDVNGDEVSLDSVSAGTQLKLKCTILNSEGKKQDAVLSYSVTNSDRLTQVDYRDMSMEAGETISECELPFTVKNAASLKIKGMLWNSFENLKPVHGYIEVK